MLKRLKFFSLFVIIAGCIEPYEFVVDDISPSLVVEAYISDKSFNETLSYPSDGRFFTVKLSQTSDVTNTRSRPVGGATVELVENDGTTHAYTEGETGLYTLLDSAFDARQGIEYKLRIFTADDNAFESGWEALPAVPAAQIGDVGFTETENQVYVMEANKWVLRTKKVVLANILVPENNTGDRIFYRWSFSPTWIFIAALSSSSNPAYRCWATDPYYLNSFQLQVDRAGGYRKELFSIPTVRNERIFEKLSVLVTQHAMTEPYYNFWKELKDQNEGTALADTPPYNLKSNFSSTTGGKVSGYFGVTSEQATRWYFDRGDLSYYVENTLRADCLVVYGPSPPAPECFNCTAYSFGKATTTRPSWWPR